MAQKPQSSGGSDAQSTSAKGTADATQPSKQSNHNATSSVLPRMSDPGPSHLQAAAASEPMAKSNSSGSNPSSSKDATTGTASPYGTRSRNRTGTARPNYAEDKDIDMEIFELYPGRADDDAKKASRPVASTPSTATSNDAAPRAANGSSRKPLPSDGKQSQNGTKDHASNAAQTSAASTPPAPSQSSSKKRKAASQSNQSANAAATESSSAAAVAKKSVGNSASSGPVAHKGYASTNLLTFEATRCRPKDGKMIADDGTVLQVNDHVYLVCEPPGEPYYLARIMEFLHANNDPTQPVEALRVNWYYRPKDIARKVNDTRAVFATMHSDVSPLTSLRGKCVIKHKAEIPKLEEYRKNPDCFWFEKLYDRYIQKNYEVIPTFQIINVPEKVKKVLDERWKYILVEQGRGKELTSAVKLCTRCTGYCASNDSVDCAVCQRTYHMNCVKPPLLKKPSRGFAWSCAACSRAQERKLEARNTPNVGLDSNAEPDDEELYDEEDDDPAAVVDTGRTSPADGADQPHAPVSAEQIYHASLWPYRYLGIHCKVEDVLDYDDRIYPRAATRVGPRHQATVLDWPGRPVQYVKPAEVEIKKSGRKDGRLSKEAQAALEAEKIAKAKRPKWVQDEPPGYVARGEDYDNEDPRNTAQLLWKPLDTAQKGLPDNALEIYRDRVQELNKSTLHLPPDSTNLLDVARDILFANEYDFKAALEELPTLDKEVFKEPQLSASEIKKFEEGVSKYGSELHSVKKHVKTVSSGDIVRFYYTWKKTKRGKEIWGNYSGRKGKKEAKEAKKSETSPQNKLQDDVADDYDDSAFDAEKALEKKRQFICKFCNTKQSRQWRRAPNVSGAVITETGGKGANKDKGNQYVIALCRRCAELWRRYAIQWEDVDQLVSKVAQAGGRAWKKKIDEELLKEIVAAEQRSKYTTVNSGAETPPPGAAAASSANQPSPAAQEPPRKKLKAAPAEKEAEQATSDSGSTSGAPPVQHAKKKEKAADKAMEKEKEKERPAPLPAPEVPKPRTMPCAVCGQLEPLGDQHLSCKECRMTVHRNCYGVIDNRNPGKWVCDMCANDRSPHVSIHYKCVLCPVEYTEHDFVEPPKVTHKKRSEKDRERERLERESAVKTAEYYRKRQEELNRPVNPREPLKRTADNNWVHVTCAVWTPEVKFGNAKALEPSEGIPSIPRSRYSEVCKACKQTGGACVSCSHCRAPVHVECAHQSGFLLGFDITPIKGSRRDQHNIVTINGESGAMSATIWCKDHVPQKTIVHQMYDIVDETGMNALQLYVQNFKRADLTLTGCARKANLISTAARMSNSPTTVAAPNRRASTTAVAALSAPTQARGLTNGQNHEEDQQGLLTPGGKVCMTCGADVSPRWYPVEKEQERELTNGYHGSLGPEAKKFVEQRSFQCHKCKKLGRQPRSHAHPTPSNTASEPSEKSHAPVSAPVNAAGPTPTPISVSSLVPERAPPAGPPPGHLEPVEPRPRATPPLTSPRAPGIDQAPPRLGTYSWPTPLQPPHQAGMVPAPGPIAPHVSAGPPPPIQAHPLQPPSIAPPPLPHGLPGRGPPPPGQVPPPSAQHAYPAPQPPAPAPSPYGDWHRSATHHPPPIPPPMNGGPPSHPGISPAPSSAIPPLMPPNLRPPPLSSLSHPSPPHGPMTNGHMAQPHAMVNGTSSPRRLSGPPPPPASTAGPGPYMQSYHHPSHAPPPQATQHLTNGMAPPRIEHSFAQVLNPQRAPYASHGSPSISRDTLPLPPRDAPSSGRSENRPASGASASPSLRNLLS